MPSLSNEISLEQIKDNTPIKRDIPKPHIIKDELLEEIKEDEIKPKKEITKINIIDDIIPSNNLHFLTPKLSLDLNKENESEKFIPKMVQYSQILNPIEKKSKKVNIEDNTNKLNRNALLENSSKNSLANFFIFLNRKFDKNEF